MKKFTQSDWVLMRWILAGKRINMMEMWAYKHHEPLTQQELDAYQHCIADLDSILEKIESRIKS